MYSSYIVGPQSAKAAPTITHRTTKLVPLNMIQIAANLNANIQAALELSESINLVANGLCEELVLFHLGSSTLSHKS